MSRTRYCVILYRRNWTVQLNGGHYGPYASQRSAIDAAVRAARENGRGSEVVVQDDDETFRTVWTFDDDALKRSA